MEIYREAIAKAIAKDEARLTELDGGRQALLIRLQQLYYGVTDR